MATPAWQPGTLYQPGNLVKPSSTDQVTQQPPSNASFDDGLTNWDEGFEFGTGEWSSAASPYSPFDGPLTAKFRALASGTGPKNSVYGYLYNTFLAPVVPGQTINFFCYVQRHTSPSSSSWANAGCFINWYNASEELISTSKANTQGVNGTPEGMVGGDDNHHVWVRNSGTGVAPAGAAYAQFGVVATDNTAGDPNTACYIDGCGWDYSFQGLPAGLVFRAVQAAAGFSGSVEPIWPLVSGEQVVDNEVTWEAVFASRVVWEATPILKSGTVEPTWPIGVGGHVVDGSISWEATDGRVKDPNCPNSKVVAIAASKVFATDNDIVKYSATTNPLDWTTAEDAGYLPFGLQTYGSKPCEALGLYRSNLVASNAEGYQMWQVDEDPANMALLDASPVPCQYPKSMQPIANDLILLSAQGYRNIAIAGASTNLQAGFFGKQIDPLVKVSLATGAEPRSLFWPGAGQYWGFFANEAYVLTMNGGPSDQSWSRYIFPQSVVNWTIDGTALLVRTENDLIWEISEDAEDDDMSDSSGEPFEGYIAWNYLDFGTLGLEKDLEGVDVVCTGEVTIAIGYNQKDQSMVTPGFTVDGDTLVNIGMVPFPLSAPSYQIRLTFSESQFWQWDSLNVYITELSGK